MKSIWIELKNEIVDIMANEYNIRVYGILKNKNAILVTDEHRAGILMSKFPGGGLEKGEGLELCLKREFIEELGIDIEVKSLFYVNEFLQMSVFDKTQELISFYYWVETNELSKIKIGTQEEIKNPGDQIFRWVEMEDLVASEFTFPIDRVVVERLIQKQKKP